MRGANARALARANLPPREVRGRLAPLEPLRLRRRSSRPRKACARPNPSGPHPFGPRVPVRSPLAARASTAKRVARHHGLPALRRHARGRSRTPAPLRAGVRLRGSLALAQLRVRSRSPLGPQGLLWPVAARQGRAQAKPLRPRGPRVLGPARSSLRGLAAPPHPPVRALRAARFDHILALKQCGYFCGYPPSKTPLKRVSRLRRRTTRIHLIALEFRSKSQC
jgi:hypothetical protein